MPTLPAVIVTLLLPFERLFDPRTWRKAQLLAMGAILSPGVNDGLEMSHFYGLKLNHLVFAQRFGQCA